MATTSFRVGDATITRLHETVWTDVAVDFLYPLAKQEIEGFDAATAAKLALNIHAWLVQTPTHTFLIDAAAGNQKQRPGSPFHQLNTDFLEQLARQGVTPEDIDQVFLTHLHVDHVGWNTILDNGTWAPTFPNAQYVMVKEEFEHYSQKHNCSASSWLALQDSLIPVIAAEQARFIQATGEEVFPGIRFYPTPGHTQHHSSIELISQGERAFFAGDVMHSPLQFEHPHWSSAFCTSPATANQSRQWALKHCADTQALYCSSHFGESSAGHVNHDPTKPGGWCWQFL